MKARSNDRRWTAASASGPTKAWLSVRSRPPSAMTSMPTLSARVPMALMPAVTTVSSVSSGVFVMASARAPIVEPASRSTVSRARSGRRPTGRCRAWRRAPRRALAQRGLRVVGQAHDAAVGPGELALGRQLGQVASDRRGRDPELVGELLDAREPAGRGEADDLASTGLCGVLRHAGHPRRPRAGVPSRRRGAAPRSSNGRRRCRCRRCRRRCRGRRTCGSPAGRW